MIINYCFLTRKITNNCIIISQNNKLIVCKKCFNSNI